MAIDSVATILSFHSCSPALSCGNSFALIIAALSRSATIGRPTDALPTDCWRWLMATAFDDESYGQRWQAETVMFMLKQHQRLADDANLRDEAKRNGPHGHYPQHPDRHQR